MEITIAGWNGVPEIPLSGHWLLNKKSGHRHMAEWDELCGLWFIFGEIDSVQPDRVAAEYIHDGYISNYVLITCLNLWRRDGHL